MDRKSLALSGIAIIAIAGMVMVSACTTTVTPSATPSASPTATPSATPSPGTMAAFNQSDNNKTVNVKSGETFTVTLEENPSTGYAWNISVTSGLTIINDTYLPTNTSLVGAGGLHEWQVEATDTGDQQFSGIYMRPQAPIDGNETAYVLKVNVAVPTPGILP